MAIESTQNMRIDARLESYKTFIDHLRLQMLHELVAGTKLQEPVFSLCVNWKAAANTHFMPGLMMHSIRDFWKGYLRGQDTGSEQAVKVLAQQVPVKMGDSLSNMKRKKLAEVMTEIGKGMKQTREQDKRDILVDGLFTEFLNGPGNSELMLSIWGSQRITYGAIFHAYENFVSRCVGLARNEPKYRAFKIKTLHSDAKAAFGDTTADYCLTDRPVEVARLVRNALAHNGGKETNGLKALSHGVEVVDDVLQIMPDDNRRLFDELKDRAFKLAEKGITLPQLK